MRRILSMTVIGTLLATLVGCKGDADDDTAGDDDTNVAAWASSEVAALDGEIEREKKRDEESEFGILW